MNIGYIHAINDKCSGYVAQERMLINLHCEKIFSDEGNHYPALFNAIAECSRGGNIYCLPLETLDIEETLKNEIKQFAHERNIRLNDII